MVHAEKIVNIAISVNPHCAFADLSITCSLHTIDCIIKETFLLITVCTTFCDYINTETKFTLIININILAKVSRAKLG